MKPGLTIGAKGSHAMRVRDSHLVPALFAEDNAFPDMAAVFSTPSMIGLMEWACVEAMAPFYEDGEDSVGVHVDVAHLAPTLPGQVVTVSTELEDVDGKFYWFRVEAHDGTEVIGKGRHRRAVIDKPAFQTRLAAKRDRVAEAAHG